MKDNLVLPNDILLGEVSNLLSEGRTVVLMAKGCSMLPFIIGSKDSVELVRRVPLQIGDIALAQIKPGRYVLHRIISLQGEDVVLKGDGNLVGTEQCQAADVCGVAVAIHKSSGKRIDCTTARFARRSAFWRSLPYIVRRVCLGVLRRLVTK